MVDFVGISLRQSDQLSESEASALVKSVREGLEDNDTFDLQLLSNSLEGVDFRWHQHGAPSTLHKAIILCVKHDLRAPVALGMSHGVSLNRPTADIFLNWISHYDSGDDHSISPDWTEKFLFDVSDNWTGLGASDEYVYHYTKWQTARKFILGGSRQLMLNPITKMGDPLEFEDINVPIYGGTGDKKLPLQVWSAIKKTTRFGIKLLCVSQDQKVEAEDKQQGLFMRQTALRGFAHPSMWHHYGEDHEGVCLVFSKSRLHSAIEAVVKSPDEIFRNSVNYQRKNQIWQTGQSFGHEQAKMSEDELENWARKRMFQHCKLLFFTKHSDWEPESEYRWVISSSTDDPLFVPIADSLSAVIVGSDFESSNHSEVQTLAKALGIPIRRIWWNNGEAVEPWDLAAFESGGTLEKWETKAAIRRNRRREI